MDGNFNYQGTERVESAPIFQDYVLASASQATERSQPQRSGREISFLPSSNDLLSNLQEENTALSIDEALLSMDDPSRSKRTIDKLNNALRGWAGDNGISDVYRRMEERGFLPAILELQFSRSGPMTREQLERFGGDDRSEATERAGRINPVKFLAYRFAPRNFDEIRRVSGDADSGVPTKNDPIDRDIIERYRLNSQR